jgi:hypothetical protein
VKASDGAERAEGEWLHMQLWHRRLLRSICTNWGQALCPALDALLTWAEKEN